MKSTIPPVPDRDSGARSESGDVQEASDVFPQEKREVRRPSFWGSAPANLTPSVSECETQGDPEPSSKLLRMQWLYRIAEEQRICYGAATFHTLTFRREPSARAGLKLATRWIQRVKEAHRKALLPATEAVLRELEEQRSLDPLAAAAYNRFFHLTNWRFAYLLVQEHGSDNGRLHYHALTFHPYPVTYRAWHLPIMRWPLGHHQHKLVSGGDRTRAAVYIAKYLLKEGNPVCNSHFGLTSVTTLLSNSSFRTLAIAHSLTALKLLRRLSLSRFYPTSKLISYLASRDKSWITLPPPRFRHRPQSSTTGVKSSDEADESTVRFYPSAVPPGVTALVRATARDLREVDSPYARETIAKRYPGLRTFGRTFEVAEDPEAFVWRATVKHPDCARRRTKKL